MLIYFSLYFSLYFFLSLFHPFRREVEDTGGSQDGTHGFSKKRISDDHDRGSGLCPWNFSDRARFGKLQRVVRLGRGKLEDK